MSRFFADAIVPDLPGPTQNIWLPVAIIAGAVVLTAAAAVLIVVLVRRKKQKKE